MKRARRQADLNADIRRLFYFEVKVIINVVVNSYTMAFLLTLRTYLALLGGASRIGSEMTEWCRKALSFTICT